MSEAFGFQDQARDSAAVFRSVLEALARPGTLQSLTPTLQSPDGLPVAAAAILLTLCDSSTGLYLDPTFQQSVIEDYLTFHCGAPRVAPAAAAFLMAPLARAIELLGQCQKGTPDYPDQSATLILTDVTFGSGPRVILSGPGIKSQQLVTSSLSLDVWRALQINNQRFPLGADVLLVSGQIIMGLPRSTHIAIEETV